jgi:manganese/zinc/iron transport system substrate-binding protein
MNLRVKPYFTLVVIAVSLVCNLPGCTSSDSQRKPGKLKIVVTTGMIKDAVENIARDKADVVALMGPGVDPHLYKASHGDLEKITGADVIFYNGLHLEGKMGKVFEKAQRIKPVVAVANGIPESELREIPGYENAHDPHIWFDVKLWENAVRNIADYLKRRDSVNAEFYEANSKRYLYSLDSLNKSITAQLETIPRTQRVLITAHDAFGYFGDAYSVEVRGLQGISTLSEFGLKDVTELVDFIIERKIKAIFVETSVSTKSIDAILEGCREKGWNVTIGGSLYSDAMGEEGTSEGTYIGMVQRKNDSKCIEVGQLI